MLSAQLCVSGLVLSCGVLLNAAPLAAQVVPDGSTATSVTVGADGAVTVAIAPSSSNGVSLNRYDDFNVGPDGVVLDNQVVAARTIVNEVTGTNETTLAGALEVRGQTAHVIVANPNGIVIDGGRFINTGRVALTTGAISQTSRQISPGVFQNNVLATVNGGKISVLGGGLSGQMDAVDLIARAVEIGGPVVNTSSDAASSISIRAGNSKTEFESTVVPGNTALGWGTTTGVGEVAQGSLLVEILRPGVLRTNRIDIAVNAKGAGARIAGEGYASSRQFTLHSNGSVEVDGAVLSGAGGVDMEATSIAVKSSKISSTRSAVQLSATSANEIGIVTQAAEFNALSFAAVSNAGFSFNTSTLNATGTTGTSGYILVDAKGDASMSSSTLNAIQSVAISSGARLGFSESTVTSAQSITLTSVAALRVSDSTLRGFGHLLVTADSVEVNSSSAKQSELVAQNGSLIVTTKGQHSSGNLLNNGGLLQGGTRGADVKNSAGTLSKGAVTFSIAGAFENISSSDQLAVVLGGAGDVAIQSGGDVVNHRGRILANGDAHILAAGVIANDVSLPDGAGDPIVVQKTIEGSRQWWTLWLKKRRETTLSYDFGTLSGPDKLSAIGATGSVSLAATQISNQGGQIYATEGSLSLNADVVKTVGIGAGQVEVRKTCVVVCTYDAKGSVAVYGGQMSAGTDVSIIARDRFTNTGGTVFAKNNVSIQSALVELEAIAVPTLVLRPEGLYNFWRSKAAWVYLRDQFGSIIADTGKISVKSARPVKIIGGELVSKVAPELENGSEIVRSPEIHSDALGHQIGLFKDLPLLWE
jgi:filamentous hemagglutinin family protein